MENGEFKCRFPSGSTETVASCQPGGAIETRPIEEAGAWEKIRDEGTRAVFPYVEGGVYALPLVD